MRSNACCWAIIPLCNMSAWEALSQRHYKPTHRLLLTGRLPCMSSLADLAANCQEMASCINISTTADDQATTKLLWWHHSDRVAALSHHILSATSVELRWAEGTYSPLAKIILPYVVWCGPVCSKCMLNTSQVYAGMQHTCMRP